jgi:hypothetical protein
MKTKVISAEKACDIQVNLTYDEINDLIYAIANVGHSDPAKRAECYELLNKFKGELNWAAKEIDGE